MPGLALGSLRTASVMASVENLVGRPSLMVRSSTLYVRLQRSLLSVFV